MAQAAVYFRDALEDVVEAADEAVKAASLEEEAARSAEAAAQLEAAEREAPYNHWIAIAVLQGRRKKIEMINFIFHIDNIYNIHIFHLL